MKNLEIKHLAPYLPYGISIIPYEWKVNEYWKGKKVILTGFQIDDDRAIFKHRDLITENNRFGIVTFKIEECQPILRPIEDLYNFKYEFIYEKEIDPESIGDWIELDVESRFTNKFSFQFWSYLFENKFDVFGLIDKGLAVDINTLK